VKLQFDPNQRFQLEAVAAVVDLFEGQPQSTPDYAVVSSSAWGELVAQDRGPIAGSGNQLLLNEEALKRNLRAIQARNDIEVDGPSAAPLGWEIDDPISGKQRHCPHFSTEMETGTGKTYVYLRTIFELATRYGFHKFIIVVPSVAVREGVLKNLEITAEHFSSLYNNLHPEHFVYDGRKVDRLHHFAYGTTPQVMVINIDAFRKNFSGAAEEGQGNVIYKESEKLSSRKPIEFVQSTRPIVIIDEPQSVDSTEKSQEAIKALNPLCTLRYSATHLNPYNLVYRLDPIKAFEMRLVKQIIVATASPQTTTGEAFVRVEKVEYKPSIRAKVRLLVKAPRGPAERSFAVKHGSDLYFLSGEREEYRPGFDIVEINAEPGSEFVRFANGRTLKLGEEIGSLRDDVWRVQIRHTVRRHLEKELQVADRGIKVLSLFFIDRVANYREYDEHGQPVKGKFALAIEEELAALAKNPRFQSIAWLRQPVDRLHNGYFAQDRKGAFRDSREGRESEADDQAYTLIMQEKERLLSTDEPLRFIFSHSALREGWDNPNVFQICTLNETKSRLKKRQEIGRGLRLPVNQDGVRVFDESVNKLYIMANESYEEFARALQTEYEEDCGVTFGKVPLGAFARIVRVIDGKEVPLGEGLARTIHESLMAQGFIDEKGRIQAAFNPRREGFSLQLPQPLKDVQAVVLDLLSSYSIERHVRRDRDEGENRIRKDAQGRDVLDSPEFRELWERIKPKTVYRVEFEADALVKRAVDSVKRMQPIEAARIRVVSGRIAVEKRGVTAGAVGVAEEQVTISGRAIPDVLAYLQNETDLTRSTLARVLVESGRLGEFFNDPQRFLDSVASILRAELLRLLVDGIKYERIPGSGPEAEWEQALFKNEELVNFLTAIKVRNALYDYVPYDSEVEHEFAKKLSERDDIRLFVKLPKWFEIDTPVGKYNPDWAIVKHGDQTVYLVRETKGTKDFLKLRSSEADKARCGKRHFDSLGVSFDVVTTADEV
jgi:type III restriction enzyme